MMMHGSVRRKAVRKIKKHTIISFDIFDTLINREVSEPKMIFLLAARQARSSEHLMLDPIRFMTERVTAEHEARSKDKAEVSLDDIYEELKGKYSEDELKCLKRSEIQTELDMCYPNPVGFAIYQEALKAHKKIIIVSDMYLPQGVLAQMLDKCGYKEYGSLYVSCERGRTKARGDLYPDVLAAEQVDKRKVLHVGDNLRSDIIRARLMGWHVLWAYHQKRKGECLADQALIKSCCKNVDQGVFYRAGFCGLGPLLYGFLQWLNREVKSRGITKILFLSRDGYLMKEMYDILFPKEQDTVYFMASRRALQVAAIHFRPDYENVIASMFVPRRVAIKWILAKWGLNAEECLADLEELGLTLETILDGKTLADNQALRAVFDRERERIIQNSKKEFEAFSQYFAELEAQGDIAVVDIGWYGNMQNALEKMLKKMGAPVRLHGYYLGIVPDSGYQDTYQMNGFLYQKGKNVDLYETSKYIGSVLELCFLAPHGSVKKYALDAGRVNIIQDPFEYEGVDAYQHIQELQRGACSFISAYRKNLSYTEPDEKTYYSEFCQLFMRPDRQLAGAFGELEIWDEGWIRLAERRNLMKTLMHPIKTARLFEETPWKMGFLKRMLGLPLPYDRIILTMRKVYQRKKRKQG